MAEARMDAEPTRAREMLTRARGELGTAIEELREIARGIHPALLTDRGLGAALEALAGRTPLPVATEVELDGRLPEAVEAAAYYVAAEALTNVVRYAGASQAVMRVTHVADQAVIEIADDGRGGADPAGGTGLRGLADRVEALDGRLDVLSPRGGGTRVRATSRPDQMSRCCVAQRVSSCRVESWSLRSTLETWLSTVLTDRWSRAAISLYM
jgi:signal transduction histidine kinase